MAYELINRFTSPNSSTRAAFGHTGKPTGITIHWWGDPRNRPAFDGVVAWLCNPAAGTSAHYVVEAGRVACIVSPERTAWHSGSTKGNGSTIGLELNPQCRDGDYETAAELIRDLRKAYGNLPLYPHNYWTATACPGNYDLGRLDRLARNKHSEAKGPSVRPAQDDKKKLEWSDMVSENEFRRVIREELRDMLGDVVDVPSNQGSEESRRNNPKWTVSNALTNIWHAANVAAHNSDPDRVAKAVLTHPVQLKGSTSGTTNLENKIAWQAHEFHRNTEAVENLIDALGEPTPEEHNPYTGGK